MTISTFRTGAAVVAALCMAAPAAQAQDDFASTYEAMLIAGHTGEAAQLAEARRAEMPDDTAAHFALGLAQFLQAIERLGQGLHRYGAASTYANAAYEVFGGGMPFVRLPVPENPEPEPITYQALRGLLAGFAEDLATAEATLAAVPDAEFELSLRVPLIRLDLDGDGQGAFEESLAHVFAAVTGVEMMSDDWSAWQASAEAGSLKPFGLDRSDVPWLQAYCHLLITLVHLPLAHDWQAAFETTFHDVFPASRLPSSGLVDEENRQIASLGPEPPGYDWQADGSDDESFEKWLDSPERAARQEWKARVRALEVGTYFDLGAFLHLMHWPVVEPDRMAEARRHLLSMVALSRENWRRINAETDDNREWLPGPHQTSLLPHLRVTEEAVAGWALFLDEFEAVLEGERLVPHWRFMPGRGINVRRMFEEPRTFDPILIAQGSAVLPYVEDGETITGETAMTVLEMLGAGPLAYFLWFN